MFLIQKIGECLYKNAYSVYQPTYFLYKKVSENSEINFFKANIKKEDIVFDIGANIGFYSLLFSKLVGDKGRVFAFEPEKNNFLKLLKNTKNKSNIHCINAAVSEKSGSITLYSSEFGLNVDFRTYSTQSNQIISQIDAWALDDFCEMNNISKIDWIKMDIQGYEYFALSGMKNTLNKFSNIKIFMEFWPYGINQSGITIHQFFRFFQSLGLNVYLFQNGKLLELIDTNHLKFSTHPKDNYHLFVTKKQ